MNAWPKFAANFAQTEDVVTKFVNLMRSEAQLGLAISGKQNIST